MAIGAGVCDTPLHNVVAARALGWRGCRGAAPSPGSTMAAARWDRRNRDAGGMRWGDARSLCIRRVRRGEAGDARYMAGAIDGVARPITPATIYEAPAAHLRSMCG